MAERLAIGWPQTKVHVEREDTGRALRDTLLPVFASLGALFAAG